MVRLITRLRNALSSGSERALAVRAALLETQAERGRIELEPLTTSRRDQPCFTARLEQVLEDSIVIDMPVCDGVPHPLARYESHLVIITRADGCLVGSTRVIGRTSIPSAGGDILHGYRLEIPASLQPIERRRERRLLLGDDRLREAELFVYTHKGPILGRVEDISAGGARLSCRNGHNHLQPGQQAHFRLDLPQTIGLVEEIAHIMGVEADAETGNTMVRLRFDQRVPQIAEALRRRRERCGRAEIVTRRQSVADQQSECV